MSGWRRPGGGGWPGSDGKPDAECLPDENSTAASLQRLSEHVSAQQRVQQQLLEQGVGGDETPFGFDMTTLMDHINEHIAAASQHHQLLPTQPQRELLDEFTVEDGFRTEQPMFPMENRSFAPRMMMMPAFLPLEMGAAGGPGTFEQNQDEIVVGPELPLETSADDLSELPWSEVQQLINNARDTEAEFYWPGASSRDIETQQNRYEFEETDDTNLLVERGPTGSAWALAEGQRAIIAGDIPTAVRLFETAIRADETNAAAWLELGLAQQHNENDRAAIAAFEQAIRRSAEKSTAWRKAHLALAASFTNELRRADALLALAAWADSSDASKRWRRSLADFGGYSYQPELFTNVESLLLSQRGTTLDIEAALGILYNVAEQYVTATEYFNRAIDTFGGNETASFDDRRRLDLAVLYNRLGASLANADRNAEAVDAYSRALELAPGMLRVRYNLGIASCNMHAYREAIEHFLDVLSKQKAAATQQGSTDQPPRRRTFGLVSDNVWASLRMALLALDRRDLYDLALGERIEELLTAIHLGRQPEPTE